VTPAERAQYEQLLERILKDVAELRASQEDLRIAIRGLQKRADRLDDVRDRQYATGSRGPWLVG
jgi:predicted butyrate kinase (DUF1464 family)